VSYQGTFVDVTEQREMERRLHREQEFARRLMDSFPDLVVALDTESRYTFASPQIFDALGYRPEELIGKKWEDARSAGPGRDARDIRRS
jgi:PAS domain S-box-containing protein